MRSFSGSTLVLLNGIAIVLWFMHPGRVSFSDRQAKIVHRHVGRILINRCHGPHLRVPDLHTL